LGFLDSQVAGYVVAQSKGAFKLVGSAIEVAPYGIATPKSPAGKALATAFEAAIKTLIANGTYGAILKHWGVSAGGLAPSKIVLNGAIS
jgi:polar amino acid transport system substrate-binding protein